MGPKQQQKKGKIITDAFSVEPHLRSVEQWCMMGKESLLLISNSLNMNTKGMSVKDMATALYNKYKSVGDEENIDNDLDMNVERNWSNDEGEYDDRSVVSGGARSEILLQFPPPVPISHTDGDGSISKAKKKKRKKSKLDFEGFKNDLKFFLREEVKHEFRIRETALLPPVSGNLTHPLLPAPSCPVAGFRLRLPVRYYHLLWVMAL